MIKIKLTKEKKILIITILISWVLLLVGFLAGYVLVSRLAKKYDIPSEHIFDAGFVAIIFGFIGAKISFFLTNIDFLLEFLQDPIGHFASLSGGFDFLGGIALAVPSVYVYLKRKGYRPFTFGDIVAPGISLAHAFGRLGCFMNGCCYGFRTETFGLRYAVDSAVFNDQVAEGLIRPSALHSLPVFPSHLVESGFLFFLTWLLVKLLKKRKFAGQTIATYFILYALFRFLNQFTRADEALGVGIFTIWHLLSATMFIAGLALYWYLRKLNSPPLAFRTKKAAEEPERTSNEIAG